MAFIVLVPPPPKVIPSFSETNKLSNDNRFYQSTLQAKLAKANKQKSRAAPRCGMAFIVLVPPPPKDHRR
jgi:hypothetical protein